MGKCQLCNRILKLECSDLLEDKALAKIERQEHQQQIMNDRRAYYAARLQSKDNDHHVCIIADGMDQNKTRLIEDIEDQISNVRLFGIIIHKRPLVNRIFVQDRRFISDSNILIETLFTTLEPYFGEHRTLYLQLDNCSKDNKNNHVIKFCCALVHLRWVLTCFFSALPLLTYFFVRKFKEVSLNYLLPGHTHEGHSYLICLDIDAMFSRISRRFKKCVVRSPYCLEKAIMGEEKIAVSFLHNVMDHITFLKPSLPKLIVNTPWRVLRIWDDQGLRCKYRYALSDKVELPAFKEGKLTYF